MFALRSVQDGFRLLLPDDFIVDDINEKYTEILTKKHSFITKPIDFLNETIQGVQVLGVTAGTVVQQQPGYGNWAQAQNRISANRFLHTASEHVYRSEVNPLNLIDKTINITFRHTLGFVNYFLLYENFFEQYCRDFTYAEMPEAFYLDVINKTGSIYARVSLMQPIMDSIDMLDLNYTQPIAQSQTFVATFKYSNIEFEFIENESPEDGIFIPNNYVEH